MFRDKTRFPKAAARICLSSKLGFLNIFSRFPLIYVLIFRMKKTCVLERSTVYVNRTRSGRRMRTLFTSGRLTQQQQQTHPRCCVSFPSFCFYFIHLPLAPARPRVSPCALPCWWRCLFGCWATRRRVTSARRRCLLSGNRKHLQRLSAINNYAFCTIVCRTEHEAEMLRLIKRTSLLYLCTVKCNVSVYSFILRGNAQQQLHISNG